MQKRLILLVPANEKAQGVHKIERKLICSLPCVRNAILFYIFTQTVRIKSRHAFRIEFAHSQSKRRGAIFTSRKIKPEMCFRFFSSPCPIIIFHICRTRKAQREPRSLLYAPRPKLAPRRSDRNYGFDMQIRG